MISVGASDANDRLASFSNYGRGSVDLVLAEGIVFLVFQPGAAPAPDHIGADDPAMRLKGAREIVEIAPVPCQPMHAEDDVRVRRTAPVGVSDSMKAMGVQAGEAAFDHVRF